MITDKMMQEAAEELYQALLTSLPDENQCSYQFSERFERRMKRLIRRAEHPLRHRILQRVASIALVLFLGFVTLLAISPSVRAAVFGWVREQYRNMATYFYEGSSNHDSASCEYELVGLPDGYEEVYRDISEDKSSIYYLDSSTKQILSFTYASSGSFSLLNIQISNASMECVIINGNEADFYYYPDGDQSNLLIWTDIESNTLFAISAFGSKNELIAMAESVVIKTCE